MRNLNVSIFTFKAVHVNIYEAKRRYAYCPYWKPFLLAKSFPFSGSHSFERKPFLLVQSAHFSLSYSF